VPGYVKPGTTELVEIARPYKWVHEEYVPTTYQMIDPDPALDVSGFEVRNAYERTFWLWRNVSNFRVEVPSDERLPDRVIFDVVGKKPLRGSAGGGSLPEGYRLKLADLAALMNAWRERALTLPRATSVPHVGEHRGRS